MHLHQAKGLVDLAHFSGPLHENGVFLIQLGQLHELKELLDEELVGSFDHLKVVLLLLAAFEALEPGPLCLRLRER